MSDLRCKWCGRPIKNGEYCRRHRSPEERIEARIGTKPSPPAQTSGETHCEMCEKGTHPIIEYKGKRVHHITGKSGYYQCTATEPSPSVERQTQKLFDDIRHHLQIQKADEPKLLEILATHNSASVSAHESEEVAKLRAQLADTEKDRDSWKHEFEMYRDAWKRELGGWLIPKAHLIDALVLTTRKRCVNPILGNCSAPHWLGKPTEDRKALQQTPHPMGNGCRDWKAEAVSAEAKPPQCPKCGNDDKPTFYFNGSLRTTKAMR